MDDGKLRKSTKYKRARTLRAQLCATLCDDVTTYRVTLLILVELRFSLLAAEVLRVSAHQVLITTSTITASTSHLMTSYTNQRRIYGRGVLEFAV